MLVLKKNTIKEKLISKFYGSTIAKRTFFSNKDLRIRRKPCLDSYLKLGPKSYITSHSLSCICRLFENMNT